MNNKTTRENKRAGFQKPRKAIKIIPWNKNISQIDKKLARWSFFGSLSPFPRLAADFAGADFVEWVNKREKMKEEVDNSWWCNLSN